MIKLIIGWVGIALATLFFFQSHAHAMRIDEGNNKKIYFSKDGKKLDAIEAFKHAMNGDQVLACDYVEAVGNSRTGKVNLKKSQ